MNNMPGKRKCSNCRRPGHDIRTCFKQSFGKTYKLLQEYTQHVRFGVLPLIKKKSSINSNTAKGGYKEEQLVCDDLNTNTSLRNTFSQILGDEYNTCSKIPGKTKIDIQSKDKKLSAQVKKYKKNQIQQLDRHWCKYWLDKIPELSDIYSLLKTLCEIPLKPNGTHVKDNFPIADRKLCKDNHSQEKLDQLIEVLNIHKKTILNYAFFGTPDRSLSPKYLIGVEYVDNIRNKIVLFKMTDILNYLETLDFNIKKSQTVIQLGDDNCISLQRKGGESGGKSGNNLAIKIIVSKLIDGGVLHATERL